MCWMDEELLCALADGFLTSHDVPSGRCRRLFAVPNGQDGLVKGIATMDNQKIITCVEAGEVSVWDTSGAQCQTVNANVDVNRMRQSPHRQTMVATGGKENDLKVWDLESGGKPIFTARNVRCDYLSLRVPVWVRDIAFLDENSISTCTAYGQIRAYDIRSGRRRPVIDFSWDDCTSFTVMAARGNNQVVAGCTRAKLGLFDIRGKKHLVHAFRGHTGGVTAVLCHTKHPYVVSSSVDRFVRLYGIQTKTMLHKVYCKSRLTDVIFPREETLDTAVKVEPPSAESNVQGAIENDPNNSVVEKFELGSKSEGNDNSEISNGRLLL